MKPELIKFVSGTKAKASEVNENFEKILNYAETASAVVSFDIETEYKYGQWVLGQVEDEFGFYESLVDKNKGHLLSDEAYWKKVSMGGGAGLEIGDIGIAPLGIDESLGKRRYLNGSVINQDRYPYFTQRVKTAIQTHASLGCTEEEWLNISAKSVGGQCGKFVVDDAAGTIRLPKIIMPIQGLTDLTKLGEIVEAGLPNITGKVGELGINTHSTGEGAFAIERDSEGSLPAGGTQAYRATFDASRCSDVYGNSDTVQQEQIQYPYFIQVATGASVKENITNEIMSNIPFVLLEGEYFTAPVYNSSWLQANEGFTGSLALHPTAYNALLIEQNPNVEVGTTVDNYTKRGLSVKLDTEDYTDYDFVLNTTSQVFRCPLKIKKASGNAVVGNGKGIALTPNGVDHYMLKYQWNDPNVTNHGHLDVTNNYNDSVLPFTDSSGIGSSFDNSALGLTTDPTKSGIETSDEGLYLYFYVGETLQNANLVNVGRVEEKVANCITLNDKENVTSWSFPSNRYIDLTAGASMSTYTAPANGWVVFQCKVSGTNKKIGIETSRGIYQSDAGDNMMLGVSVPVAKGDTYTVEYVSGTPQLFRFIYAEGVK